MQTPTPTGCPARAATPSEPIVVLRPVGKLTADFSPFMGEHPAIRLDSVDYSLTLYRNYQPQRHDAHPAHWVGQERRRGSDGRWWTYYPAPLVCDDFGDLVPARAAA